MCMYVSLRQTEAKMHEKTFSKVKNIVIITQKRRHIFSFLFFMWEKRNNVHNSEGK